MIDRLNSEYGSEGIRFVSGEGGLPKAILAALRPILVVAIVRCC